MPPAGAILDRLLHQPQTIAIAGRIYRLKDTAAVVAEECKNKKIKSKPDEPSTAEPASLNGSLSGSARFVSLLTHFGQRLIFSANES